MTPHPDEEPYHLPEPPCLIRRVNLRNYKSIRHADVTLGPFTILVGRNGSGKSNFLDALHFVADSLQNLDRATESRGGVRSVSRRIADASATLSIELDISLPGGNTAEYRFKLSPSEQRRFVVVREDLVVRAPGAEDETVGSYAIHKGKVESASIQNLPRADAERLYLTKVSGFDPFREVYDALAVMGFYNLNPEEMRKPQYPGPGDLLHRDGSNVASVVRRLEEQHPDEKARLESYLSAIVPDLVGVKVRPLGSHETLEFRQKADTPEVFDAKNMSDGTLRATGILAAVGQLAGQHKPITLIGVEEPETSLHPAAARALMDALREASVGAQVVVTTHSPEILDNIEKDHEILLAVRFQDGVTRIAPLDQASRHAIDTDLYTPGELLRLDQLEPDRKDLARQEHNPSPDPGDEDAPPADRPHRRRPR